MKIVGATYNEVSNASGSVATIGSKTTLTKTELQSLHRAISNGTKGQVTSYLYNQWYEISMVILPNDDTTYYEYDAYGRLITSKNQDQRVINEFKYSYRR